MGVEQACLHDGINNAARTCTAAESGKDVYVEFTFVARNGRATCKGISHGIDKGDGVAGKEQSASATHLSGSLTQIADGRFDRSGILDNAFHGGEVVDVVKDVTYVVALDEEKLFVGEGRILAHHTEIGPWTPFPWHHLFGRIDIEKLHRLLPSFLRVRKLFKHAHLECAKDFTSSTT